MSIVSYRQANGSAQFFSKAAVVRTRNARFVASASSALTADAGQTPLGILLVPLHGATVTQSGGRTLEWEKGRSGVFLPPIGCRASSTARSVIGIDIDPAVLEPMVATMIGGRPRSASFEALDFAAPRTLKLKAQGVDLGRLLIQHCALLDTLNCDAALIERAGFDDAILRAALYVMCPQLLLADTGPVEKSRTAIDTACDYIDANLARRITLTDLEAVTGLSSRRLQYAFRAAFDRTPMQWVTLRRLEAVHRRLQFARDGENLTGVAGAYFTNLGDFARLYKRRYGQLPSQTLKSALNNRTFAR
ncbi:helix-turn-helix domain-containing protein [Labrys monachus]|uniref:AraC-like DNA-binding protein n=1 Tax=Labrys monachus TaxID=217067 RepID=A0ABU0F7W3_9HYPH|nr:AraC family transcriptional regulator [Labrys monachus]MDQ0390703.1 AraC-like DNA-binding protein [Labrys monachus]